MNTGRILALIFLMAMTVGCDRVTKHLAASTLAGMPRQSFLADTVRLDYAENEGAFLGLGSEWPPAVRTGVFIVWNALSLIATAALALRRHRSRPELIALALFLAGGLSNLMDRVVRGSVIDFLNVGVGPLRTGIFNVADMAVMLGLAILVFTLARSADEPTPQQAG